jgi:hypothetical protein
MSDMRKTEPARRVVPLFVTNPEFKDDEFTFYERTSDTNAYLFHPNDPKAYDYGEWGATRPLALPCSWEVFKVLTRKIKHWRYFPREQIPRPHGHELNKLFSSVIDSILDGKKEIVRKLLESGANPNLAVSGWRVLELAAPRSLPDHGRILREEERRKSLSESILAPRSPQYPALCTRRMKSMPSQAHPT